MEALKTALIPRAVLFGSAERSHARISPDGSLLAYLAPHDGKLSVWARSLARQDDRLIAHDPTRPIPWLAWQGDGKHVLYLQDSGNENHHLFRVALDGTPPCELTPGEGVRCSPLAIDAAFPHQALVLINQRNPALFDVARVDFRTGTVAIDTENPGDVVSWLADRDHVVRAAVAMAADGARRIRVRNDATSPWRELDRIPSEDLILLLVAFSGDNEALYVLTSKGANAARLVRYDLDSGECAAVLADAAYDVSQTLVDPASREVVAAAVLRERLHWCALAPELGGLLERLRDLHEGDFAIVDATADGMRLVVRYTLDAGPSRYYLFDRRSGSAQLLFSDRPELLKHTLAPMRPIRLAARDGLALHGYLTLPVGVEPKRLPTVLLVHGGPWHRDRWGYDETVQWLANRGYAVLQVNFRGSTGYGKEFLNAGDRQWAGAMRTDLLDARDWAIAQEIADPARFAIFGGSYGGYAVLAALAFTPEAFTCGIDIVGPSNLETWLAAIPPYMKPMIATLHQRVGEDPQFLRTQSPLFAADRIRAPLLIAQGANDPRCRQQESDQIVQAMRDSGVPVTYVVFPDEGHGFSNPANAKRFTALAEAFLARHLGGRLEAPHADEDWAAFLRAS